MFTNQTQDLSEQIRHIIFRKWSFRFAALKITATAILQYISVGIYYVKQFCNRCWTNVCWFSFWNLLYLQMLLMYKGKWTILECKKKSIPVAESCDVELDFLPMPLPPLGERSWSTAPFLRSCAVSDKLPSVDEKSKSNSDKKLS